ncbi:MAG: transporter substrate-binding domain-containing protein, partial [Clostridia bacterium]|nr:transporter substrate-binding domain-containing protein [Clostridia bacterium]
MDRLKRTCMTLIMALLLFCVPTIGLYTQIYAAEVASDGQKTIVKVGFYQLDGFFEYDANGQETGYGVEYLNELTKYANIEWEYVPVDSWEEIKAMLKDGTVDVRMPVSAPIDPSTSDSNFTTESVLPSYHAIMTLKNKTDLYYQDYGKFREMKIAVTTSLMEKIGLTDYLNSVGVQNNLVYYDNYNSCRKALENGTVDALISNVMDLTDDMKILDKFAVSDCYITTLKGNPCYLPINNAMTELALEDPSFKTELYKKYYPERSYMPYTREETDYIVNKDYLTVAIQPDREPVSYYDKASGQYQGIVIEIADEISKKLGIPFHYIPITTEEPQDMLDQVDLVMPLASTGGDPNLFVSRGILKSEILIAVSEGSTFLKENAKIGVLSSTHGIRDILKEAGCYEIVSYDSNAAAFKALRKGDIDGFANSSYVINWLLENPRYHGFRALEYTDSPLEFRMCGKVSDPVLQSALEKAIAMVSDSVTAQILERNILVSYEHMSMIDKMFAYRWEIVTVCVAFLLLIIAVILYNRTRTKYIREIEHKSREQEKANHAKSEFLARMSHDLRTPMNGILGLAELMKSETDDPTLMQDILQLEMTGQYLLQLINDTLDVSKIEAGKMELHTCPVDSKSIFQTIFANAMLLANNKGVTLTVHTQESEYRKWVSVIIDAARLQQIMMNLLSNAVKFTPKGGSVDVTIETLSVTDEMVTVRYIIKDTGIGMEAAFLTHIFEPFSQENRLGVERENGTGL